MSSSTNSITGTPVEASTALPNNTQQSPIPMPQPIAAAVVPMTDREVNTFYNAASIDDLDSDNFDWGTGPSSFASPSLVELASDNFDDWDTGPSSFKEPTVRQEARPSLFRRMASAVASPVVNNAAWMVWRGRESIRYHVEKSYDGYEFTYWLERGYNFPANVTVTGDQLAILSRRSLPKGLKFQGSMIIDHENIPQHHIMEQIKEKGRVSVTSEGMEIEGNLTICNVLDLEELAKGIKVKGNLTLDNCHFLKSLSDVQVGGSIIILNCPKLENLPKELKVRKDLVIYKCPLIKELPEGLGVHRDLILDELDISSLPKGLIVTRHLKVKECPYLVLPNGKESLTDSQIIGGSIIDEGNFKVVQDDE